MPPQSSSVAKARYAFDGIRAQIRDLHTETIANLALRARELGDVIALWYGEGDMVDAGLHSRRSQSRRSTKG